MLCFSPTFEDFPKTNRDAVKSVMSWKMYLVREREHKSKTQSRPVLSKHSQRKSREKGFDQPCREEEIKRIQMAGCSGSL